MNISTIKKRSSGKIIFGSMLLFFAIILATDAYSLVSVSQLGYHPQESKRVIYYTSDLTSILQFSIVDANTNSVVVTYPLARARDYNGNTVNCQGNMPCLVGDFTAFKNQGKFYIKVGSQSSYQFDISTNIYRNNVPTLLEFFDATMQQDSAYHADMNSGSDVPLIFKADGSFIMTADQASSTLVRLGNAYRKNPSLFSSDKYNILQTGKPDMQEYIIKYVDYLQSLQGVVVNERYDGVGVRLNPGVEILNAFVPGPTSRTSLEVYIPGSPAQLLKTVPVKSLCGANNYPGWQACIDYAAQYYKCQVDEPCLNLSYIEKTGTITHNNYPAVSDGWYYEFGCYLDVDPSQSQFTDKPNPCMIFDPAQSMANTAKTLLAFAQSLSAVNDFDAQRGQQLLDRTINTYNYVKNSAPSLNAEEAAYYGAAGFILYDYTKDTKYIYDAFNIRGKVSTSLYSDKTHGNEFYWEEYIAHKTTLNTLGLSYSIGSSNPEDFFVGKMYYDYKDRGIFSIDRFGDRVYQLDNNIQFQNSRFILTEGLLASKTRNNIQNVPSFIHEISDSQISWLTGANGVQKGVSLGSEVYSVSFIFGIGNQPQEYHSRYLINSGYAQSTNNKIIGIRDTGYQFKDPNNAYVYLDGVTTIQGNTFGANGNKWHNEPQTQMFIDSITFNNGLSYIPGWINGPFDTVYDGDTIFNYHDDRDTYEFTESTNEIVATAIEYFAYLDAYYNNKSTHSIIINGTINSTNTTNNTTNNITNSTNNTTNNSTINNSTNTTTNNNGTVNVTTNTSDINTSNTCYTNIQNIPATCEGTITSDTFNGARNIVCSNGNSNIAIQVWDKPGSYNPTHFEIYKISSSSNAPNICIGSTCISDNGYAKSDNYPICVINASNNTGSNNTNTNNNTDSTNNTTTNNTADNTNTTTSGYLSVKDIPSTCKGGTITSDLINSNGGRAISCSSNSAKLSIIAYNKPTDTSPTYFEMYRQFYDGTGITLCLSSTCITDNGYAKSPNFPITTESGSNTNTTLNNTGNITANITINTTINNTDNMSNSNSSNSTNNIFTATLSSAEWYPQGLNQVWVCKVSGGSGQHTYDFYFGDGDKLLNIHEDNNYHIYSNPGTYTANCIVHDQVSNKQTNSSKMITV